jgi:predicted CoA-binding protein
VVGCSADPSKAGHYVPSYLQQAGWRIVPVNPHHPRLLGEAALPSLRAVPPPVTVVAVFRPAAEAPAIADDAIAIGATALWLQSGIVHLAAAERARAAGLAVVMDACLMVEHRRRSAR